MYSLKILCIILIAVLLNDFNFLIWDKCRTNYKPECSVLSQEVTLSPKEGVVIEDESLTLLCSYNGTNQVLSSRWRYSAHSTNPVIVLKDKSCVAAGFVNNTALYDWTCYGNNSFSLTIKIVARKNHGEIWGCRLENIESNTVKVYVIVPVPKVEMNTPEGNKTTISEHSNETFVCITTPARPASKIEWFISETFVSSYHVQISNNTKISNSTDDEGFITTTGTVLFGPMRAYNNWFLFCTAKNVNNRKVESKRIQLNVTYAPDGPPSIKGLQNNTKFYVIENKKVELICISTGGNPRAILTWKCMNKTPSSYTNETTAKSEITWIASKNYSGQCICTSNHIETSQITVTVNIEVLYPPSNPVILKNNNEISQSYTVSTIINNSLSLYCESSSNPKPRISWKLPDGREIRGPTLNITHININNTGKYLCNATNEMHASNGEKTSGSAISYVTLKLLYPPTTPFFRYKEVHGLEIRNMSLDVVIGDNFKVACTSSSQPEPTYTWNVSNEESISQIMTVESALTDLVATCIVTNVMNETSGKSRVGKSEAKLSINVLYPPERPMITLQTDRNNDTNILNSMKVIENIPFKLKCESVSKPKPSYSWYGPFTSISSVLALSGISRKQGGSFSCHSYNVMVRTFGLKETGENSTSIQIHVLYAPEIGSLQDQKIIERSSINVTCPVVIGNPSKLSVVWKRTNDRKTWKGQNLVIKDVSRGDSATYTCIVNNTMIPTTGEAVNGINNRSFDLGVLYNTSVLDFFVKGHFDINPVIVDENTSVEFTCNLASNPKPNAAIYFMTNILKQQNGTLSLSFMQKAARCEHSGVYKCTGENKYNYGTPSKRFLTLHVRCFPRPSPYVNIQERYFVTKHDRLTISFTGLAYPIPPTDGYKWRKQVGYVWKSLTNSDNVIIDRVGLLSNLTIVDVRESDFGTYRLEVDNSIGIFEQRFIVGPKETPETPKDLQPFETANTLTLQWKPGLDGGYPQTFHLNYRIISQKTWTDISIPHNGEDLMNYTLTNLARDAEYEINIYAVNILGQSAKSVTLSFKTKGIPMDDTTSSPLLYILLPGSLAVVLILAVVLFIFMRRRRAIKQRQRQTLVSYENENTLKENEETWDGRTSVNGDYDEIGPEENEVQKREKYEKLTTSKEPLHGYEDIDLSHQNSNDEQRSNTGNIQIGKAGQVIRYIKQTKVEGKKKDDASMHTKECTSIDETQFSDEQYENLKL